MALVIGHRGCPPATDNTLAAIHLAARSGADGVELDCRLTRGGEVVLEHDSVPFRTSWIPLPVGVLTTRLATAVPLRGGGRRPTLAEALDLCHELRLVAFLDLKAPRVASAVARHLAAAPEHDAHVWSSSADALTAVGRLAPGRPRALLGGHPKRPPDRHIEEATALGLEGVNLDPEHLAPERVRRVLDAGLDLWSGTGSREGVRTLVDLVVAGVDLRGFTTDHPAIARAALG